MMMNRKQKRLKVIQYFLKISQAQEEVQKIQNELISHLRFNPASIFKKISGQASIMKQEQLIHYIEDRVGITDKDIIQKYINKYQFGNTIQLNQFIVSILPYTPNVLREVTAKIEKQMETKYLDKIIQNLYHQLLELEMKSICEICFVQKQISMTWDQLKKFILKDLNEKGKKIDTQIQQPCSIINIRKWLQLWIHIEQYKILNIMRWFGGFEQPQIQSYYSYNNLPIKCLCSSVSKNVRSIDRSSLKRMQCSTSPQRQRLQKVKSESIILNSSNVLLKSFLKYIETIVKSERRLELIRETLSPHKKEVQLILHEIASKKSNYTKLGKIIIQIEQVLRIKADMVFKLLSELQNTKIDNNFIFSLFATNKKSNKSKKLARQQIISEIYEALYTFCLSKATLKSISKQIRDGSSLIFSELDQNNRGYLVKQDMKLILKQSKIPFKEQDLNILMNHFGDGENITVKSFKEVFQIQSQN